MNKQESYQVLALLQANYPDAFRGMSGDAAKTKIGLWADIFADEPFDLVVMAAKAYMATDTKGFMPTVGQLKDRIDKMRTPEQMTGMEAWAIVAKALRNSCYGAEEEFQRLPDTIRRVVGSPSQLKEWAQMDTETVQSVVSSNFQKSFRTRQDQEREVAKLPAAVRSFVAELAGNLEFRQLAEGSEAVHGG